MLLMKTLLLIDAHSIIHRAFHALPPLTSPSGEPTGALFGLTTILMKTLRSKKVNYIGAAFDRKEPTFREKLYTEYKAHRPKTPEELEPQLEKAKELLGKMSITCLEKKGFEADDIIGTLVQKLHSPSLQIIILTGDLDALQLVKKGVIVETPQKGGEVTTYNDQKVEERYGLKPNQITDYKGLVGDSSDNIPGVQGIGPKTAQQLLKEFKTVENLYAALHNKTKATQAIKEGTKNKLLAQEKMALLSKKLATIETQVPIEVSLSKLAYQNIESESVKSYLSKLGFKSIVKKMEDKNSGQATIGAHQQQLPLLQIQNHETIVPIVNEENALTRSEELQSTKKLKVAHHWKTLIKKLWKEKKNVEDPIFDITIAKWMLNPEDQQKELNEITTEEIITQEYQRLNKELQEQGLEKIFKNIEMPLIRVLAQMEEWGVMINTNTLKKTQQRIKKELKNLEEKIYKEAGQVFNINSPLQVGNVLLKKLAIKTNGKKTPGGSISTAEKVLKKIKEKYPIAGHILEYRESFKMNSTYIVPLLNLGKQQKRISTNFIQTGTATGRISSEKPNLQNIPQESKWAKPIRQAFESEKGWQLLSCDYSQLELRLLAHASGDEKMKKAFEKNADIHALTASEVLKVPLEEITPRMRRLGKTLNFGIIYGMGVRRLSEEAGINTEEAKTFIEEYFKKFPKIKNWQDQIKRKVQENGFVENENGRRRWFGDIYSSHQRAQAEAERAAVNMPIQSLEADVLKMAMIKIMQDLQEKNLVGSKAKLILTIHDELLLEVKEKNMKEIAALVKTDMEEAHHVSIPLKVEVKTGKNWGSMQVFYL